MVNAAFGYVDTIGEKEKETIFRWKKERIIHPKNEYEKDLYNNLIKRKYIVDSSEEDKQFHNVITVLQKKQNTTPFSSSICFVLTYNCNFACPYCYEDNVKKDGLIITPKMVDTVFGNCPNISSISLFGGEPLLPSNRSIIDYIVGKADKTVKYAVITNGYHLLDYFDLFSRIEVANIQVTIDGTELQHNKTRHLINGSPTYQRIVEGVEAYVTAGIPVTIRMNVSGDNIEDCFREKEILLNKLWGKDIQFELQPLFQSTPDEAQLLSRQLYHENITASFPNRIFDKTTPFFNFLNKRGNLLPIIRTCDREGSMRYYDPLGNIYNCILAVGDPSKAIGTYYPKTELKEKSFLTRDISQIPQCLECANALLCGGGCPNGLPDGTDLYSPNCGSFVFELLNRMDHQNLVTGEAAE